MKHEQSAPAGYRPRFAGTMKLYLVRHKEYGELTVNGVNKYEAVHAAARKWGVRWTAIARECEYAVFDALEDMCIDPGEIPSAAENAENLEEAICCFIDYGEYSVSGIMREVRAAYKEAEE